jgi:hypothetical protein
MLTCYRLWIPCSFSHFSKIITFRYENLVACSKYPGTWCFDSFIGAIFLRKVGNFFQSSLIYLDMEREKYLQYVAVRSWSELFTKLAARTSHRYLMTRLSLQVVYLWRHVSSTAPPFILWWWNLEILLGPLHRSSPLGEILRPPENSVPQTIVLRYKEIVGILCTKQQSNGIVSI